MAVKYANAYTEVYKILECLEEEEEEGNTKPRNDKHK